MIVSRRAALDFRELPGRLSADPMPALGGASVRVVRVRGAAGRAAHRHPLSAELILVVRGRGTVWEDGERAVVAPGDWVLIEPGRPHATLPEEGTDMELVCFFPCPDLERNLEELPHLRIEEGGER